MFEMKSAWGSLSGWLYETVLGAGMGPLYARFLNEAIPPPLPGAQVVDLGCGQGQVAALLAARYPACQVLGLDLSPAMIRRARRSVSADLPNLKFGIGDALDIPLDEATVDLLVSVASIKFWPRPLHGLEQGFRVLKPGGCCCILEADSDCTAAQARHFVGYWRHVSGARRVLAYHWRRWISGSLNSNTLSGLLTRGGFEQVQELVVEELPFVVMRARKPLG